MIALGAWGQVRLNRWQGDFYDALELRDMSAFGTQLLVFLPVAGALLPHALERMAAIPMGLGIIWLGLSLWMDQRKTAAN